MRPLGPILLAILLNIGPTARSADLAIISGVDRQPLEAQVRRVVQTLDLLGAPLAKESQRRLDEALAEASATSATTKIQQVLDPLCLAAVTINPESRVKVAMGPATPELVQHGWRVFLLKVHNEGGVTAPLHCQSTNSRTLAKISINTPNPPQRLTAQDVRDRWMELDLFNRQPLGDRLSGLELEYRVLQLYSRDAGRRDATFFFDVGQGTQDLGFRNEASMLFNCLPAVSVRLAVIDDDGTPTMAAFVIRDAQHRVYPARSRRLAPDMYFHDQIYRADGETVQLPAGKYRVTYTRGPEYRLLSRDITVPATHEHREHFRLARWINMAQHGWYSGDHHVHAAGCAHYDSPTQGVTPDDMWRQIRGEDLNVGCVLSWGPCWYYQKQFFGGKVHSLSTARHLMRYDVECSGFPSAHAGHICLLRLREDDYPGTTKIDQWPSWDLPILKWAKSQGAVTGFAHSGFGLTTASQELPNYELPRFDGIGANEYIVDVTHGACDFISAVDTPIIWELNIWYHTLNCGYTTRISGETDFPCISGQRLGLGRSYVRLPKSSPIDYDRWIEGVREGSSYVTDGASHLFDFEVNRLQVGAAGHDGRPSVLAIKRGDKLNVRLRAAALLDEQPNDSLRKLRLDQHPYWHLERAREGTTRQVPIELIVNGQVRGVRHLNADGTIQDVQFDIELDHSSWVAVRIFPSAHTNPIFVELDDKPIRANPESARWCRRAVDICWESKRPKIKPAELPAAAEAYDHARRQYDRIIRQSAADPR